MIYFRHMNYLDVCFLISKHAEFNQLSFCHYFQFNVIDVREKSLLFLFFEIYLVLLSSLQSVFVNVLCRLDRTNVYPVVLWFSVLHAVSLKFSLLFYSNILYLTDFYLLNLSVSQANIRLYPQHIQSEIHNTEEIKKKSKNFPLF